MFGKFDIRGTRPVFRAFARNAGATLGAIALIGASWNALAQSSELPSGTVSLHIVQAGFVGGGSKGHGVLHYQGQNYPFTTAGAGIGGFGVSRFDASGAVYNLKSVGDFAGPYATDPHRVGARGSGQGEDAAAQRKRRHRSPQRRQ